MTKKIFTAAVMCATALSPILSTPAYATTTVLDSVTPDAADGTTLANMQSQCDALAAAHSTGNQDIWTGTVVEGDVSLVSGPTEVGSHTFAANGVGEQTGGGTFTPAHRDILGDPFRVGGSVNMFGIQEAVGGYYSASSYDFQNDFTSTYSHAFSCDISVQVYHAAVHHNAVGHYVVDPAAPGNSLGHLNECNAYNDAHDGGAEQGFWGTSPQGNCLFNIDQAAYDDPSYYDPDTLVDTEAGVAVNQDQTNTLLAHEDSGEGFSTSETLLIGQVVVCISPGKKGGTWTTQNGYTGSKCTTTYFNTAPSGPQNNVNTAHNWVSVPVI